jgi:uncharacterized membrane protein
MSPSAVTTPARIFRKATVLETVVLLAVAWLIPFAIHLAPWSGTRPLGAYLLPMFWATFVAAYLFGPAVAILVGLFAPAINLLVTGLPAWKFLTVLSCELVVFAVVAAWAVRRWSRLVLIAPLAYIVAKLGSMSLQLLTGVFGEIGAPTEFFAQSLKGGAAGLVVLAAINAALVWFYPKQRATSAE